MKADDQDTHRAILAVWKIESGKLIAGLARTLGDVGQAEEIAQDALVTALEQWPRSGTPANPGAWLWITAKRRAIDVIRRRPMLERKHGELARELDADRGVAADGPDRALDDDIGDDRLALLFTACHPILPGEARVALTLRLLCGLSTAEVARAFLITETAASQRIVRAKRALAEAAVPFETPHGPERAPRLRSVLESIYLVFNEGYSATAGEDWTRPELCGEALRLGRIAAGLAPEEPEVHGLVAMMEIQASRLAARVGPSGEPLLLLDQDRGRWDALLIRRGLAALARAEALIQISGEPPGAYVLQAAIAACHARAAGAQDTDWERIVALYGALQAAAPSAVVELNRAVAVAMASGPEAGLAIVERLAADPALADYHLLPSVRGDFLARLGRFEDARAAFELAASLTRNGRERDLLLGRAAAAARGSAA